MNTETLLRDIEAFCRRHRMAETYFGARAVNNGKLLARLREGRTVTLSTAERVRAFMAQHDARRRPAPAPRETEATA